MADIQVANTDADLSGNTVVTEENAYTITGLHTYSRSTNAPFACISGSAVVTYLNADKLDGQEGAYYLAATNATGTLAVNRGGTGAATFTDGGVLLGSGTSAITATAVLGDGVILIGDASGDPTTLDVGSSTSITILGTVATGVWQGTAVANAYVAEDLTIEAGTVNNTVIGGTGAAAGSFTTLNASDTATVTAVNASSTLTLNNTQWQRWKDSGGTARNIIRVSDADVTEIHPAESGGPIYFVNFAATVNNVAFLDNGNVGIGTTAPTAQLQIKKTSDNAYMLMESTVSTGASQIDFSGNPAATGNTMMLLRGLDDTTVVGHIAFIRDASGANSSTFTVNTKESSGSVTERLRVTAAGNVGIGTTAPFQLFHAAGGVLEVTGVAGSGLTSFMMGTGTSISLAADAVITLSINTAAIIMVEANTSGATYVGGLFFATYNSATVIELGDPSGRFEVTDTGSYIAVYKGATTSVCYVKNRTGGDTNIVVQVIHGQGQ